MSRHQTFVFRIAALASYVIGYLYIRYVVLETTGYNGTFWPLLFGMILIAAVEAFCIFLGRPLSSLRSMGQSPEEAVFFAACALAQSLAIAILGLHSDTFELVQIFFWHFTLIYWMLCRTGMLSQGKTGPLFLLDAFEALFPLPWSNLFLRIISVFRRTPSRTSAALEEPGQEEAEGDSFARIQKILIAVISILLAVCLCAYAWTELAGVSNSFSGLGMSVSSFFRDLFRGNFLRWVLENFFPYFLLSLPVSAWLFGLAGGGLLRSEPPCSQKQFEEETKGAHFLPVWSFQLIMGALSAVYLLFFIVSLREIGGQILLSRRSASEACLYAVSGFWQLIRIVALNFAVLLGSCLFGKVPLWKEARSRWLLTVLFLCSFLFGLLAFWKLIVLYLAAFGATPRRVLSGWIVVMLLFWTVLSMIRFYRRIPAARIGILTAAASFSLLCFLPVG